MSKIQPAKTREAQATLNTSHVEKNWLFEKFPDVKAETESTGSHVFLMQLMKISDSKVKKKNDYSRRLDL